ncbi:hypothetical protein ACFYL6_02380 [Micromonospora sp. NPDC007208]|uniref:hypothetical protein n=1 Tax=Micromonospora sp. NPDC007208 TaxID=3364236 RepID=UPI0036C9192A
MPPRRHPRSWLAVRLRSAAGAVQRLAGRVEPAGHLPPPSETPTATPRRFGEPPQHWLDLVAAHAPGLLHDLDLDPSPTGTAEAGARDGGRDQPTGRVDADGANPGASARLGRFDNAVDVGRSVRVSGADGRGPGASGDRGPTRSRAESRTGRSGRPSRAGERPDGTGTGAAGPPGGGVPSSGSDGTTPSSGSTWPDTSTPPAGPTWPAGPGAATPPVRRATRGDTAARGDTVARRDTAALDASGLPRSDGSRQPVRSMVFGPHTSPSGRAHRSEAEAIRTTPHPPRDAQSLGEVDHGPGRPPGSSPVRPTAGRLSGGRDGFPDGSADDSPPPGADQRGYPAGRSDSTARASQVDAASYGRPAGPTVGEFDASWTGTTATSARNPSTSARGDLARVADGGPWLALPGEPAQPGHPNALRGTGTGAAGGGRVPGLDGPPDVAVRVVDPWPALPDDTALWSVAGAALDTVQLTRLDREQAGD